MPSYEYIAGLFDGEGHVTIVKPNRKNKTRPSYELVAQITNTHRDVLAQIQNITGGNLSFHLGQGKNKPHYRLVFHTRQALDFLKAIQPFCIIKREQIDIAIEFSKSIRQTNDGRYQPLTDEELATRHQCYITLKALHGNQITVQENRMDR